MLTLAVTGYFALLTLEWVTVSGAAGGFVKPFHLGLVAVAALAFLRWPVGRLVGPVLHRFAGIHGAYLLLVAVSLAGGLAFTNPYFSRSTGLRVLTYAVGSLVLAGVVARLALEPRARRMLALAGAAAAVTVAVGITVGLAATGANPLGVLGEALAKGDPDIVSNRLLRTAFRSNEDLADVGANLRHKVFLAVLLATFVGLAFMPSRHDRADRSRRRLVMAASVLGAVLVVLSLSRSTILCLAVAAALGPLRSIVRNRARPAQAIAAVVGLAVAAALLVSPVAELLGERFAANRSYERRLAAAGPGFLDGFGGATLAGTTKGAVPTPHNLVLDAWLSGGVAAFVLAVVLLLSLAGLWLAMARRYLRGRPGWHLPVGQQWVLGMGLIPLVRAFTAGNQFHMVEWSAIGVFTGLVLANERLARERRATEPGVAGRRRVPVEAAPRPEEVAACS